jgi:arylsulfatase A-like enzyme
MKDAGGAGGLGSMSLVSFRGFFIFLALLIQWGSPASWAEPSRPNVVFFLVDDMGWMDCGAYGSKYYRTPHLNAFAKAGMRFTQAYAQPLCSPTRASLLTGQYSSRHRITTASGHQPPGWDRGPKANKKMALLPYPSASFLAPEQITYAEAFKAAGYRTAHLGKWHLGLTQPYWPEQQGFDVTFHCHPDPGPPGHYFSPYGVVPRGEPTAKKPVGNITDGPDGEYITDRLTDEAIRFIRDHAQQYREQPFLLNLWHYGVHGPWGHKAAYTAKAAAEFKDPTGRQGNPIMASMLHSIDESLGRLLKALEKHGLSENTIVIINSDNGGNTHSRTQEDSQTRDLAEDDPRLGDWRKWAGHQPPTNNAPLRDGKASLYEGGVRVPLMWRWPGKISAGAVSEGVVGHIDLYPTLCALAAVPVPADQKVDGMSYADLLLGKATSLPVRPFFDFFPHQEHGGGTSVRLGEWKLIRWFDADLSPELYDLSQDISEAHDLAAEQPAKVAELSALVDAFLRDTAAELPQRNPAYQTKNPKN